MIHRYRIFQFRPKTNVRHPKSPNVRPNTNFRERFVFACTFGHFTELLAISASKVLLPAAGPSQFMHFQCRNCQTFGKMAESTAKTNVLLMTETQIQCRTYVRTNVRHRFGPNLRPESPFGASLLYGDPKPFCDTCRGS